MLSNGMGGGVGGSSVRSRFRAALGVRCARLEDSGGYVVPAVIFVLLMLSTLAVASLVTADDEMKSSRAVRESIQAFYSAEAGLNEVWATWDDSLVQNLNPGDSLDLGWKTLPNGASYRAVIHRYDNGGQEMFGLIAEGRGAGAFGGQRMLSLSLSKSGAVPICCTAAARGGVAGTEARLDSANLGGVVMSGRDTIPPAWGGVCDNTLEDIPGIEWADTTTVEPENGAVIEGTPQMAEDPTIDATNLFDWGAYDYDDLVAMADHTFPDGTDIGGGIGPAVSSGNCVYTVDTNWGAPEDASNPCFDFFPIIHGNGDLRIRDGSGVGQGILLVDGELRIEDSFTFYGIIIVKDRVRLEDNVRIYGGVIVGDRLRVEDGANVRYSQCAVNRATEGGGVIGTVELLSGYAWGEALR